MLPHTYTQEHFLATVHASDALLEVMQLAFICAQC